MDLILINGIIETMDNSNPRVEAVAVKNGKITEIGSTDKILKLKKEDTKVIDLEGKLLIPGFNDSHMHLLNYGVSLQLADLVNCTSIDNMIDTVKDFINQNNITSGKWIRGMRWNHNLFLEKRLPDRYDLDKISVEHPVILSRVCGHVIAVNSKALELAGINKNTPQVEGGLFDLDENDNPTGIFREKAIQLIINHIPKPGIEEIKNYIRIAADKLIKYGITSVQSDDFPVFSVDFELILEAYKQLINEGDLSLKIYEQCNFKDLTSLKDFIDRGYYTGHGDDFFKIGPLKLLADGSLGARTAYLSEPYSDDPSTYGIPVFTQEELDQLVSVASEANLQLAIHAIGDKAMDMAMESIKKVHKPNNYDRHSIIHCQITNRQLLDKFKSLNLLALIQPLFVATDLHFAEERVGKNRVNTSYNWKGMLDRNIIMACSSDCPVESPNVLHGIYAAVTRKDLKGYPESGWLPEQKLTVAETVYCYTMGAAYVSFDENKKGSITPGKYADMVVLSDNIFDLDPDKIKDVDVLMTFVNGKLVYSKQ